ncbi:MAG: SRPBCC family protein [Herminiimonas sp.]|nr:SRPBCC family protein [Herminiimonas sp.]
MQPEIGNAPIKRGNTATVIGRARRSTTLGLALLAATAAFDATAHSASRQKLVLSTTIHASAEQVWALVGDYNNWQRWLPVVERTVDAGDGRSPGALRTLVLKDSGAKIVESLDAIDNAGMTLKYRIRTVDIDIFPVNTYSSTITIKSNGAADSIVEWRGAFFRADQNFDPPEKYNDDTATAAVTALYGAGLANLKKVTEQSGR